jgi:hypothetical protein
MIPHVHAERSPTVSRASAPVIRTSYRVARLAVVTLAVTTMTAACLATGADRSRYIGPPSDRCLTVDSDCRSNGDCCTDWCAAGTCALKGGGG